MPDNNAPPPPPPPPTLEQLAAIFAASRNASTSIKGDGGWINWSIDISHAALAEQGYSFITSPEGIRKSLAEALARLVKVDQTESAYSKKRKGSSVEDCIAFLHQQIKILTFNDVHSALSRKMFQSIIDHLQELHGRQMASGVETNREEQARRKAEEDKRKANQKAWEEAIKAKQDQAYRSAFGGNSKGEAAPPPGGDPPFEDIWRIWEQFRRASAGAHYEGPFGRYTPGWNDPRGDSEQRARRDPPKGKPKRPWYEVLGVPITADRATIKAAARRLRSRYHPDRCQETDATERMAEVNVAHDEAMARF